MNIRLLGIDYGTKRVGIALSDDAGDFAFPHVVIENSKNLLGKIKNICEKEEVVTVVIGQSLNYKQQDNPLMADIRRFKKRLENEITVPVHFEPEFLTSQEAKRLQGDTCVVDASAAALILQGFIDKRKNGGVKS